MNKNILIPLVALMVLAMVGAASAATVDTVEIRGEVQEYSTITPQTADRVWNATNFAAFWYDLDAGTSTETLKIVTAAALDNISRTIDSNELIYTTDTSPKTYKVCKKYPEVKIEDKQIYYIEGWMAEKYVALGATKTDKLCKLLVEFDTDDKKTLSTGEAWDLGGGFTLAAQQIDLDGNKVWFSLSKDGKEIDNTVVSTSEDNKTDRMYVYTEKLAGVDKVPVFSCYVDAVFRGTDTNIVQVRFVFLIDNDVLELKTSDTYGIMEVTKASGGVELKNKDNSIDLSTDSTEQIMGDMYFKTADDDAALRFYPMVEKTEPGIYEVRGTVKEYSTITPQAADIVWNAANFAAFWYDLDAGTSTETLKIVTAAALDNISRTIDSNELIYTTDTSPKTYKVCKKYPEVKIEDKQIYYIEGWMAEKYVALGATKTDKLCKLLVEFDTDDKKTLSTGEAWDLGGGFTLAAQQIDLDGNKVWFSLSKDGKEIDNTVVSTSEDNKTDRMYVYTEKLAGVDKVPVFSCYVDAVFRGTDTNIVQVRFVFLIDNDVLELKTSDTYGIMEVTKASGGVELKNKDNSIDLSTDSTEQIMGDMYFKTADDDAALRFYPMAEMTVGGVPTDEVDETATPEPTEAEPADGNVTAGEGEGADGEGAEPAATTEPAEEAPTEEPTEEPTPEPTKEKTPGFEAVFAISGLLAIAYLVLRQRD